MAIATRRDSKYLALVRQYLKRANHVTNNDILEYCRQYHSQLSATTIHRITTRMMYDGEISIAPPTKDGCMRFDNNLLPHSHLECNDCGQLCDATISLEVLSAMRKKYNNFRFDGPVLVKGRCKECQV
ncbi:MAG TPA: transcriptional repressor [Candidatus Saccharibacteria bacterium]|jgi:Fe2+ or Zn2+ uptake regulation protein|nr:transcriptional repressor [Candidatus Saccharibacteria bacterium]HMR38697.1 transcriptional repressor [Candidatus Saccharibacteria bacterium]